jgi:hypothetical protein
LGGSAEWIRAGRNGDDAGIYNLEDLFLVNVNLDI